MPVAQKVGETFCVRGTFTVHTHTKTYAEKECIATGFLKVPILTLLPQHLISLILQKHKLVEESFY